MVAVKDEVVLVRRVTAYDEILDVLETRREYVTQAPTASRDRTDARLNELAVVKTIINTLKNGESE